MLLTTACLTHMADFQPLIYFPSQVPSEISVPKRPKLSYSASDAVWFKETRRGEVASGILKWTASLYENDPPVIYSSASPQYDANPSLWDADTCESR